MTVATGVGTATAAAAAAASSASPMSSTRPTGSCQKITQITAGPDSNKISMLVDIEIGRQRALRQSFLLHRESNLPNSGQRTGSSP
jgi:hypothetical protein